MELTIEMKKMKIFCDTTPLMHYPSGISIYTDRLLHEISVSNQSIDIHTGISSINLKLHSELKKRCSEAIGHNVLYHPLYLPGRIQSISHNPFRPMFGFKNKDYDIIFFPGHICPPHVPFRSFENAVFTVHDMFWWHDEFALKQYDWQEYFIRNLPAQLEQAANVITVSEFSRKEIMKYASIQPEKIIVIPEAVQWNINDDKWKSSNILQKNRLTEKGFFLAVSSLDKHKNYISLLSAFENYCSSPDYAGENLVIVGKRGNGDDKIIDAIQKNSKVIRLQGITSEDLRMLYHRAKGFLSVSLLEGFGMPLLEAMTCGCPVCHSTGNSMDEIGRNSALKVAPLDIDAITEAFKRLSAGGSEIDSMAEQARKISLEYSWETTARQTVELFHTVSEKSF